MVASHFAIAGVSGSEVDPVDELGQTRHDGRTRGHTDGRGVVVAIEDHAVRGQGIDVGRFDAGGSVAAERADVLVVRHEVDDVGSRIGAGACAPDRQGKQEDSHEERPEGESINASVVG